MSDELPPGFRRGDLTAKAQTDEGYSDAYFECSEYAPGPGETESTPNILVTLDLHELGVQGTEGGFLILQFRQGASLKEGEDLAKVLRKLLVGVSLVQYRC